jgi:hypothetical protein
LDELHVEFGIVADISVVRLVGDTVVSGLFGHVGSNLTGYGTLWHADVLTPKEELPIQIGNVDRIQVNDLDGSEPRQGKILEQFASDSSGSYQENLTRLNLFHERFAKGRLQAGQEIHDRGMTPDGLLLPMKEEVFQRFWFRSFTDE